MSRSHLLVVVQPAATSGSGISDLFSGNRGVCREKEGCCYDAVRMAIFQVRWGLATIQCSIYVRIPIIRCRLYAIVILGATSVLPFIQESHLYIVPFIESLLYGTKQVPEQFVSNSLLYTWQHHVMPAMSTVFPESAAEPQQFMCHDFLCREIYFSRIDKRRQTKIIYKALNVYPKCYKWIMWALMACSNWCEIFTSRKIASKSGSKVSAMSSTSSPAMPFTPDAYTTGNSHCSSVAPNSTNRSKVLSITQSGLHDKNGLFHMQQIAQNSSKSHA